MDHYEIEPADQHLTGEVVPAVARPSGGIYDLPLIGGPAREVRSFYDGLRPLPQDSAGVVVGKQILRYGTVVAAGTVGVAAAAIVAL